jgi:glycosyltransferase involved in cell wall biosynthesis
MRLSIVIPTLNEEGYLRTAVTEVRRQAVLGPPPEILVADCGSVDGTADLAVRLGTRLITAETKFPSRAVALNQGAQKANGEVLLFLDADTLVPHGYDKAILRALRDPAIVGGAFEFALEGPQLGLRLVELINRVRYRIWPLFYGDQGVFARTSVFRQVGGYPEQRLLEASAFCARLRRQGRLVLLRRFMKTSPRRFLEGGIYRVLSHDCWIWWLSLLGRNTDGFGEAYQENNHRRGLPRGSRSS